MNERGGAAVEMVIMTPLLLMFMLFVIGLGRMAQTKAEVDGAARDAARTASVRHDPQAVSDAVEATLADHDVTCQGGPKPSISRRSGAVDTVTATVRCTVSLRDLSLVFVPGTKQITSEFTAPIDHYLSR